MKNTSIEWTDDSFNSWNGCEMVSPGCLNCYAEAMAKRFGKHKFWGRDVSRRRLSEENWAKPGRWDEEQGRRIEAWKVHLAHCKEMDIDPERDWPGGLRRRRVFANSVADWLDPAAAIDDLVRLLDRVRVCRRLDWLLLSKRPQLWRERLEAAWHRVGAHLPSVDRAEIADFIGGWLDGSAIPANVWLGTSVEDQVRARQRIPELLTIPARTRFLSCEPLLEGVDLLTAGADAFPGGSLVGLDWVIVGGESGPGARPFDLGWARVLQEQCRIGGAAFFCKQLGTKPMDAGAPLSLRDPKGGDWSEWPAIAHGLRAREFPTSPLDLGGNEIATEEEFADQVAKGGAR